jgi:acetyltransferase
MAAHYLEQLFKPRSIALFGASNRPDAVGGIVYRNILEAGFAGPIVAINPKHKTILDRPAFASLAATGKEIDLAVVATPAPSIPAIVDECGEHGVPMMLILSAGFRETGDAGRRLENEVVRRARRHGIRLMGPNCLGIIRPDVGVNLTFGNNNATSGNLALVSQSGAICTAILDWADENSIGFSAVVSTGISADLDFGDYLDYLVTDPNTRAILMYIEGISDSRRFMSSLRAAARIKPVIALKAGKHAAGAEASLSHTGALVGSDEVFSAALERSGVLRVESIGQLFAAARALSSANYRASTERLVVITNGGGPGVMAADRFADQGVELAPIAPATMDKLNKVLPAVWSHSNPVDVIGDATPERYQEALDACLADPGIDGALVILTPQAMTRPTEVAQAVIESATKSPKLVMTSWMGGPQIHEARKLFRDAQVPCFTTVENAVDAFAYVTKYNRNQRLLLQVPARLAGGMQPPDRDGARLIIEGVLNEHRKVLTEPESIAVLTAFGVPVVRSGVARSANEALVTAETIGYPIAMKVLSHDITHKSDMGGVRLNIVSAQEVRNAYRQMLDQVRENAPEANIEGVTIEKMHRTRTGRELMVGVVRDPVFGPVISFGSGGTTVEILADTALSLPPLNRRLAKDLVGRTRVSRLLEAHRGVPAADVDALIEVLVSVSAMACELPWIQEMDINPLIADETGVVAVDARIVVAYPKPSTDPYDHLAIHPYPAHLAHRVQLNDGTDVLIRPIRPEDAESEARFVRELSDESKYFRFMNTFQELSQEMLIRLTQIDYHNEMALIAVHLVDGVEKEQIGVARYAINVDKKSCEFALAVGDDWQGRGVGQQLMKDLMAVARTRDLETIEGQVLANNKRMLRLMGTLGFEISIDPSDSSIKRTVARLHQASS